MEFDLIEQLKQRNPVSREDVLQGIGDDCARVTMPTGFELAVTTDTLIEAVHFPQGTSAHSIGYKALAVNLSDLAAMGAEPAWVSLALSMPTADEKWLANFAEGFFSLAEQFNVQLIGGDTTQGSLSITIHAQGLIPEGQALTRSGAQIGDYILVTGQLGQANLELLRLAGAEPISTPVNRLNYPEPRVIAGMGLRGIATAAIDLSDGLISDLGHILNDSGLGAQVHLAKLPMSQAMREDQDPAKMIELALAGGDDYELCFTVPDEKIDAVNELQYALKLPITHIGNIEKQPGLRLHREGAAPLEIASGGYQHFSEKKHGRD